MNYLVLLESFNTIIAISSQQKISSDTIISIIVDWVTLRKNRGESSV